MRVSVIFVSYNTAEMSIKAIDKLLQSTGDVELEVIVIDNASRDDSVKRLKKAFPHIKLIQNESNVGFGRANNQALGLLSGEYVLLLNTDAFVEPDSLYKSVRYMQTHPRCGVMGARLVGRDGIQQPACRSFPTPFNLFANRVGLQRIFPKIRLIDDINWDSSKSQTCDWVPGCYYLIRKEVLDEVGLFDPLYFLYNEEVDHCFAVKNAGWEVHYFADTTVVHIGGESAKSDAQIEQKNRQVEHLRIESEFLYFRKNHGLYGLLAHIFLTHLADMYDLIKALIRSNISSCKLILARFPEVWIILHNTRYGTRSTR